jgi:hypothetical protein
MPLKKKHVGAIACITVAAAYVVTRRRSDAAGGDEQGSVSE